MSTNNLLDVDHPDKRRCPFFSGDNVVRGCAEELENWKAVLRHCREQHPDRPDYSLRFSRTGMELRLTLSEDGEAIDVEEALRVIEKREFWGPQSVPFGKGEYDKE